MAQYPSFWTRRRSAAILCGLQADGNEVQGGGDKPECGNDCCASPKRGVTTVHTLASGSSGNALVYQWDGGRFLVDAGISCRRICAALGRLGMTPASLDGILITHTHADHISGLRTLLKRTVCPVLAGPRVSRELEYRFPGIPVLPLPLCQAVEWNGCTVTAFPTSHDSPGSCGFRLDTPDGGFGLLTDTGYVTEEAETVLPGAALVLLEANHDVETLRAGPYPYFLKQRILGAEGHLCNADAAAFAVTLARAGAREIVLAHLSAENNTPALAEAAVAQALRTAGLSPALTVAPRDALSGPWVVGGKTGCGELPCCASGG